MATLTEIARQRRKVLRDFRKLLSANVRDSERAERFVMRVINRRRAIPSTNDLEQLIVHVQDINGNVTIMRDSLERSIGPAFDV